MGRSGGGGSMGGGFSHSSHSGGSRSHSSHTGGSSFRSSGRSSSQRVGSSSFGGGPAGHRPPPPPRPHYGYGPRTTVHVHNGYGYGGGYGYGPRRRSGGFGMVMTLVVSFILIIVMIAMISSMAESMSAPKSTVNRERLSGGSFTSACVKDEIGWVREDGSSESKLGSKLEYFWKKTGVQPYVVLLKHDTMFDSSSARWEYADLYYENNIGREDAILLIYFDAEPDGNWEMVKGLQAGAVMDDEATDILWGLCDRYWYDVDHYNVPEAIDATFTKTADTIMTKSTTGLDIVKIMVIGGIIISLAVCAIVFFKLKRKAEHERAQETEAILQAGQNQQTFGSSDPHMDDLTSKYD